MVGIGDEDDESAGAIIRGGTALTLEDFTAAWARLPQVRAGMVLMGSWVVGALVLAFLVPYVNSLSSETPLAPPSNVMFVLPVFLAGAFGFALWRGRKRFAQNALADTRGAEGVFFRFEPHGVSFETPGRDTRMNWDVIPRAIETPEAFILYASQASIVVAPKRSFAAADVSRISALLAEHVKPRELRGTQFRPFRKLISWVVLVLVFLAIWRFIGQK